MNKEIMDWTPKKIRIEMMRADVRQADIVHQLKVSRTVVTQVIDGKCVSDRIRKAIAKSIGKDVKEIWPSYYLSDKRKASN